MRNFIDIVEDNQGDWYDRDWFRGSVIVDEDNEPLIVHHFTYFEFQEFDRMWGATYFKRNPEGIDTIGIWFTDNPQARYVSPDMGGRRMDCILRMKRAKYFDDIHREGDAWMQLHAMVEEHGGSTATREFLKQQGYDGIILQSTYLDRAHQTVLIVFEPDQVRVVKNELLNKN